MAIWGCGTSCAMFAIVNLKTGRVITPEGFHSTSTVYFDVDDHEVFSHSQRNLDGHGPLEPRIACAIHLSDSARAERSADLIGPKFGACCQIHDLIEIITSATLCVILAIEF